MSYTKPIGDKLRKIIHIRASERCEYIDLLGRCKMTTGLSIHHITPRKDNGNNSPKNLILVCKWHKNIMHANLELKEQRNMIGVNQVLLINHEINQALTTSRRLNKGTYRKYKSVAMRQILKIFTWGKEQCPHTSTQLKRECWLCWNILYEANEFNNLKLAVEILDQDKLKDNELIKI